ncbi:MAG: tRNA glutamyl-Q(34) synthetase GluQRS [Rhodospirillales bacterium]
MIVTRFAPSPTGHLHLGHAYSALLACQRARQQGGHFLLRLEDIDNTRCRPEYIDDLLEDLQWLGIDWDGPVLKQSGRMQAYQAALDALRGMGLLYPCFCTRRDILAEVGASGSAPQGIDGPVYPGICRGLSSAEAEHRISSGVPYAWRLDMTAAMEQSGTLGWTDELGGPQVCNAEQAGDVVLGRKDIGTSYHLAVTVDDTFQNVSLVIRGQDLFQATHIHRLLQALLGLPTPVYHHHHLLTDSQGRRLAKRDRSATLRNMRQSGLSASDVRRMAGLDE